MENQRRWWLFNLLLGLFVVLAPTVWAQGGQETVRITFTEVPGGGEDSIREALAELAGVEVRPSSWFNQQVRARAFQPDGIADRPSDLVWVLRGGNISILMDFAFEGENEYVVRLITPEEGRATHQFIIDRGDEGPTRGGLRLLVAEMERYLRAATLAPVAEPTTEGPTGGGASTPIDEAQGQQAPSALTATNLPPEDPEAMRQRAAAERRALAERLSSDFLWARLNFRLFNRNFTAAGEDAVSSFSSAPFPGFELDIEAFPFVLSNPDMIAPGVYVTYNHGFDGLTLIDETQDPAVEQRLGVNNLALEGGMIYRLDSPLDESMRQLRFKIGARYEAFSIAENPLLNPTSMMSMVVGTRLVLPIDVVDRFAVTAAVDIVPFSSFMNGAAFYGGNSFSYGFGSEMGFVFEMVDSFFMSAGYTFRVLRSNFDGESEDGTFVNTEVYEMNQGLRAGIVYQY